MSRATLRIQAFGNCRGKGDTLLFFVTVDDLRPPTLGLIINACLTHYLHWVFECPKLPTKNKAYKNLKHTARLVSETATKPEHT
jgi:hypothetical protein